MATIIGGPAEEKLESTSFAQAIEEFLLDTKNPEDRNSDFFRLVSAQLAVKHCGRSTQDDTQPWADSLAAEVEKLRSQHQRTNKTRRFVDRLGSFVARFNHYATACDVLIQAGPSPAILLYGGARIILLLTQNVFDCYETVLNVLEEISYNISSYHKYARVYDSVPPVRSLLVKSYKVIIKFWMKTSQLLSTKALKVLISRNSQLSKEWQKHQAQIRTLRDAIVFASQATEADTRRLEQQRNETRDVEAKQNTVIQEIVRWAKAGCDEEQLDFRQKTRENANLRYGSTCDWVFEHESYKTWIAAKHDRSLKPLWFHSRPGTGKSVMASVVAQGLQAIKAKTVCYFFSFSEPVRKRLMTLLRSLAVQLLSIYNSDGRSIPDAVQTMWQTDAAHQCMHLTDPETAVKVVQELLKHVPRVHIIIDGMDECTDRFVLLQTLNRLMDTHYLGVVKWFLTSRSEGDIESAMRTNEILEIDAPVDLLFGDVRIYITDMLQTKLGISCTHYIDALVDKSEGNFLWAYLNIRVLEGDDYTSEDERDQALDQFPIGLKGYYERTLHQLVNTKSPAQVELARRVFTILVAAIQPLRMSELSHAVAALSTSSDMDFNPKRLPKRGLIKELCSGLITFGGGDDALLEFCHKSVRDFFLEDPMVLKVSDSIAHFFTNDPDACSLLGHACLKYISFSRYDLPRDIESLLKSKDHAFLRHAAAFWHHYVGQVPTKDHIYHQQVVRFVQSPAFWNCLLVQACTVPYMFARYYETDCGFTLRSSEGSDREDPERVHYATALPFELDVVDSECAQFVGDLSAFVVQWHPVLNTHPNDIAQCVMNEQWEARMQSRRAWRSNNISAVALENTDKSQSVQNAVLAVTTAGSSQGQLVSTIETQEDGLVFLRQWHLVNKNLTTNATHLTTPSTQKSMIGGITRCVVLHSLREWSLLDLHRLEVCQVLSSNGTNEPEIRGHCEDIGNSWDVCNRSDKRSRQPCETPLAVALHCSRNSTAAPAVRGDDSGYGSVNSGSETSSLMSDTYDSVSDQDDCGDDDEPNQCMVIVQAGGNTIRSFWRSNFVSQDIYCDLDQDQKIGIWSERLFEACIAHLDTGEIVRVALPEPADVASSSPKFVRKEFHFSGSNGVLYYILHTADDTDAGFKQRLTVSCLSLTMNDGVYCICQTAEERSIGFTSAEISTYPSVLTAWTEDFVYVALPELYCQPKVVRLQLGRMDQCRYETISKPIYFPSTTPHRKPGLSVLAKSPGKQQLVLSLDSQCDHDGRPVHPPQPGQTAMIMTWDFDIHTGWRLWDEGIDAHSERCKLGIDSYQRLRGHFVDAKERFNVPIRSGLDWTRKAVLSCA